MALHKSHQFFACSFVKYHHGTTKEESIIRSKSSATADLSELSLKVARKCSWVS